MPDVLRIIGLSSFEFWGFAIAALGGGLVYVLSDIIRDAAREDYRGDPLNIRRPRPAPPATWGDHKNLGIACAVFVLSFLAFMHLP